MKIGTFALAAGALALGLATWTTLNAQGPLYDRVTVNLPYTVTIGDKTLQPGDYVIQQLRSQGGNDRVLLIYSDNGMKFETSAMTIPTLDPNTPEDTRVILHHYGPDYYFDRIWIQGKNYGYEFPLPPSVKQREKERMQPVSVAANYQAVPENNAQQQATTQQNTTQQNTMAERTEQPATTAQQTTPPAATTQETTPPATTSQQTTTQQSTTTKSTTTTEQQPTTTAQNTTEQNTANREMPKTAAGWLMLLLGGSTLSGAGLALRRRR